MKIYIVSDNQATLDLWVESFPCVGGIYFVNSSVYDGTVDVVALSGMWGFDRYGGSPSRESAQILPNELNDGLPGWIVIPPFLPLGGAEEGFGSTGPTFHAVFNSLLKVGQEFGFCVNLALDLTLLGMDNPEDVSTSISAARAIEVFLAL